MLQIPPTLPQLFALLFIAAIGALIGELVGGASPKFGFLGAIFLGLLGTIIAIELPLPTLEIEPVLEELPLIRGIAGAALLVGAFGYYRKRSSR